MDDLSNYVAEQNVRRFSDQLRSEIDEAHRAQLQKMLIEEEDKLTYTLDRLRKLDQVIADGDRQLELQRTKVAALRKAGRDATVPSSLLKNLQQLQSIYKKYRLTLLDAINRNGLLSRE